MAETLNIESGAAVAQNPQPNSAHRDEMLEKALGETFKLDQQIKVQRDRHVKPLTKKKSEIKANLRKELNMTADVFNARYASYKLEGDALAAGDDATLENLRHLFTISPVGTQMDLVQGLEDADAAAAA